MSNLHLTIMICQDMLGMCDIYIYMKTIMIISCYDQFVVTFDNPCKSHQRWGVELLPYTFVS